MQSEPTLNHEISSDFKRQDDYHKLPGPKTFPLVGMGLDLRARGGQLLTELEKNYGAFVRFPLPSIRGVLVNDPEHVHKILAQTERQFYKGHLYKLLEPITGIGLVNNQGPNWKARRRTLNPLFRKGAFNLDKPFQKIYPSLKKGFWLKKVRITLKS